MLKLSKRALGPSSSVQNNITYMTSVTFLRTLQASAHDDAKAVADQIKDLLCSTDTRLWGLQMLEFALQQSPDTYFKARWTPVLFDILQEPDPYYNKEIACNILTQIIAVLLKDPLANSDEIQKFVTSVVPFLLNIAQSTIEWKKAAFRCLSSAVKAFPSAFDAYKDDLLKLVIEQTNSVSSKNFEIFAECFSHLPLIQSNVDPADYQQSWNSYYSYTLNTLNLLLNNLLSTLPNVAKVDIPEGQTFDLPREEHDFGNRFLQARQFINLCRCLTKMLSTKTKHPIQMPMELTLDCIKRIFNIEAIEKLDPKCEDNEFILSTLCQLQIAALHLMEPILINFNSVSCCCFITLLIKYALKASVMSNISKETVSQIRHCIWKLLDVWITVKGPKPTYEITRDSFIVKELLKDIRIPEKPAQPIQAQAHGKSKKRLPLNVAPKDPSINNNWYFVCKEALKALRKIIYGGISFVNKKLSEEIFIEVIHIAYAIHPSEEFPFPYSDESCRKNLYKVLLAQTIVAKPTQIEALQCSISIFNNALRDPSTKVTSVCCEAAASCRLFLHPKKPPPLIKEAENSQDRVEQHNGIRKYGAWSTESYPYIEDIPPIEEVSDHISQSFHSNETDMHSSDYSHVDVHYSEQEGESGNRDDMLEMQSASQCQEEEGEESDEGEDEDDDEEEDDEDEDDVNSELGSGNPEPHHSIQAVENLEDQSLDFEEYESSTVKTPLDNAPLDNALSNCNTKNMHLNGVHNSVPDEVEPAATENVTNENGIYVSEDDEIEEEVEDEKMEEGEKTASYPAEKRVPEFIEAPAKRPKLEVEITVEGKKEAQNDEEAGVESENFPTLEEMKNDFVFSGGEEVTS